MHSFQFDLFVVTTRIFVPLLILLSIFAGQTVTYTLTEDDEGHFGVDSGGNLYKASNKTNFETSKSHKITVKITDNGSPLMSVSFAWVDDSFQIFLSCNFLLTNVGRK